MMELITEQINVLPYLSLRILLSLYFFQPEFARVYEKIEIIKVLVLNV